MAYVGPRRECSPSGCVDCNAVGGCPLDTSIPPIETSIGKIQTISFCTAFIEQLLKTGERSFLKYTVSHKVRRGFTAMK